jgi:putative zinc finger/helix-turn-helix YgiT family protein
VASVEATMLAGGRCGACGREGLRDGSSTVSVALRCGVTAAVAVPERSCPSCGEVHVDRDVLARAQLAAARALADAGVHTGDAFRHMRKVLGLRAVDLARLLDVTPETISHWETGRAAPARAAFVALAAMIDDATQGRTATLDRLTVLAEGRPWPRSLMVELQHGPAAARAHA